jgi:hypothetical protein
MTYKRRRWPNYALWALEDALTKLSAIEASARTVQTAARDGNPLQVIIMAGDIRTMARDTKELLVRAKAGEYDE